jgi:hypothetical protein
MMAGGELRATRRPVCPHGHELFAEGHVVVLAPGDGLPAVLRRGIPGKGTGYPTPSPQIRT